MLSPQVKDLLIALKEIQAGLQLVAAFTAKEIEKVERVIGSNADVSDYREHEGGAL